MTETMPTIEKLEEARDAIGNGVSVLYDAAGFAYGPSIEDTIRAALLQAIEIRRGCKVTSQGLKRDLIKVINLAQVPEFIVADTVNELIKRGLVTAAQEAADDQ